MRWFWNGDSLIEGPAQIAVHQPGIYTANAWNGCGEAIANDTLVLNTIPAPEVPVIIENNGVLNCSATGTLIWLDSSLQPILGATSANYQPAPVNATYFIQVTSENGCSEISAPYNYIIEGIEAIKLQFSLSPNPASEMLMIQGENLEGDISILNAIGQSIGFQNTNGRTENVLLDVSEFPAGLYFVRIGSSVKPLIIQ